CYTCVSFYTHGHHPHHHSSPTRRSSDLDTRTGAVLHGSALHSSGPPPGPIPSCPAELFPQQYAALSAVRPQAKIFPVPTLTKARPPLTATGVRLFAVDPLPSAP